MNLVCMAVFMNNVLHLIKYDSKELEMAELLDFA